MNTAEAYSLAADPDFLRGRTRRTCGELLPELFDNRPGDELMFGRAECDAQVLVSPAPFSSTLPLFLQYAPSTDIFFQSWAD